MKKIMKCFILLFTLMTFVFGGYAIHVPQQEAQLIAAQFYRNHHPAGTVSSDVGEVFTSAYQNVTTYYVFNFLAGGFVMIAADDACLPVLGYSFDQPMPREVKSPAAKAWFEAYSKEISMVISHRLGNTETRLEWDAIKNGKTDRSAMNVDPLLTTTWDQGCYYNTQCPADPGASSCGHVYTGCVATAMAQIMKYHDFPPQGVGTHSYTHPLYGVQTADFGATFYNWSSMPNNVTGANSAVAKLMYHSGVAVDMQYAIDGSGAFSDDVPDALKNYFNYWPEVKIEYKNNFPNTDDFKNLLRTDLDQQLPVYYSGSGSGGHAFVCDGYRLSDGKFHFNWGWSGYYDGWFTIGALNPGGSNFNDDNAAVLRIKPYNSNLIVRMAHPVNNAVIGVGYPVNIEGVTVRGVPVVMKLFIDNTETLSVSGSTLQYTWNTASSDLGSHQVRVYSYTATDTVYAEINLNVAEWVSQISGFTAPARGISFMSAVDSNIVWASAYDDVNPTGACSDFTRTLDGGTTWIPGIINNTTGLASAMIFAMNDVTAYVPMYKVSGNKPMGMYMTPDGGVTWSRQTTASFSNSASFPNCVHFFNATDGWCMGDPIGGEFEIYTTDDGGTTWTQVAGSAIANPLSGEFGVVGYYSAVGDTVWFGTNMGRVYRSADKGHTFTAATVPALSGKYVKPYFRNGSHGLVQDKSAGGNAFCESFDGGLTWTMVSPAGPVYGTDLQYIPGTENTWVSSGGTTNMGASYSFDGGHIWSDFEGTQGARYLQMTWVNNHCGWAGGVSVSATENGAYKFIGLLMPPLPAPTSLSAVVTGHDVHLDWSAPAGNPAGYNMYRNGLKLNATPITSLSYDDLSVVSGQHTYCVKAVYSSGESEGVCTTIDVAVGIGEQARAQLRVTPNPATTFITLGAGEPCSFTISDLTGRELLRGTRVGTGTAIFIGHLPKGIYVLRIPETGQSMKFIKAE